MIDPVRPIAIEDIEQARERIAETVLRTPLVQVRSGRWRTDIRLKLENLQPTNAYKIRGGDQCGRRLSDEARARRASGRSAPAMPGRALPTLRGSSAFLAPSSRSRPRRRPSSTGCARLARTSCRCPTSAPGSRPRRMHFAGLDGTFVHPFDNHDFIAGHGTMGLEILEDLPGRRHRHLRDRRRRADHRRRQRHQGLEPDVKVIGAEPETAAPYALSLREGGPRKFAGLAGLVRRRRRRQERHRTHVAADAAGHRRCDYGHARADRRCDAADRREVAGNCGRCRCLVARRGTQRRTTGRADRLRRLGRQYRPRQVRRTRHTLFPAQRLRTRPQTSSVRSAGSLDGCSTGRHRRPARRR